MRLLVRVFTVLLGVVCSLSPAAAQTPAPILDSRVRTIRDFDLSPDGRRLAWVGLAADREMRIFVRDLFGNALQLLAPMPRLSELRWASDNRHIYICADPTGDEKSHVLVYDTADAAAPPRDLTPFRGKKATILSANTLDGSALVTINLSVPEGFDVYRVSPAGGAPELVEKQAAGRIGWMVSMKGELFGHQVSRNGHLAIETRLPGRQAWRSFAVPGEANVPGNGMAGMSDPLPDGSAWILMRGAQDLATPQRVDLASGRTLEALPTDGVDADRMVFDRDNKPLILQSFPGYPSLKVFDPGLRALLQRLPLPIHSFLGTVSTDIAINRMVLSFTDDTGEENLVYVDRAQGVAQVLFHQASPLVMGRMPKTVPVQLAARDGLMLHGYLTYPADRQPSGLPLVLLVHGGPWVRDTWGFDAGTAALALRGYAILRVNFRGSGGYGRAFEMAGRGEWGGKMQDDVTDAACWAVKQGIADSRRMAVMGGSYGGYAALRAMERTPRLFAAAVEMDGPTDLPAHLSEVAPYVKPFLPILYAYIGSDRATQWERSPLAHVERIEGPILAFQGFNDGRVRMTQLTSFELAMRKAGKDITAEYLPNEGHGISYEKDFIPYIQKTVAFLDGHLKTDNPPAELGYCR